MIFIVINCTLLPYALLTIWLQFLVHIRRNPYPRSRTPVIPTRPGLTSTFFFLLISQLIQVGRTGATASVAWCGLLTTGWTQEAVDVRLTWAVYDEAGYNVVPNELSLRDLVSRPDNIDETVLHLLVHIHPTPTPRPPQLYFNFVITSILGSCPPDQTPLFYFTFTSIFS